MFAPTDLSLICLYKGTYTASTRSGEKYKPPIGKKFQPTCPLSLFLYFSLFLSLSPLTSVSFVPGACIQIFASTSFVVVEGNRLGLRVQRAGIWKFEYNSMTYGCNTGPPQGHIYINGAARAGHCELKQKKAGRIKT